MTDLAHDATEAGGLTMIDLALFTSKDPARPAITQPWSRGEFSYATNGHVLVRVPQRAEIPFSAEAPNAERLFELHHKGQFSPLQLTLPDEMETDCDDCDDGRPHNCPFCQCTCSTCGGTCKVSTDKDRQVRMRGSLFSLKYVRMLSTLSGLKFATTAEPLEATPFIFDGGDGLLMPMSGVIAAFDPIEEDAAA